VVVGYSGCSGGAGASIEDVSEGYTGYIGEGCRITGD
jgi:hypothetical protein